MNLPSLCGTRQLVQERLLLRPGRSQSSGGSLHERIARTFRKLVAKRIQRILAEIPRHCTWSAGRRSTHDSLGRSRWGNALWTIFRCYRLPESRFRVASNRLLCCAHSGFIGNRIEDVSTIRKQSLKTLAVRR